MEVIVYNSKGEDTGKKAELSDAIFGIEPNTHAIYLDVKQHLANKRQGTHKTKERAENDCPVRAQPGNASIAALSASREVRK